MTRTEGIVILQRKTSREVANRLKQKCNIAFISKMLVI